MRFIAERGWFSGEELLAGGKIYSDGEQQALALEGGAMAALPASPEAGLESDQAENAAQLSNVVTRKADGSVQGSQAMLAQSLSGEKEIGAGYQASSGLRAAAQSVEAQSDQDLEDVYLAQSGQAPQIPQIPEVEQQAKQQEEPQGLLAERIEPPQPRRPQSIEDIITARQEAILAAMSGREVDQIADHALAYPGPDFATEHELAEGFFEQEQAEQQPQPADAQESGQAGNAAVQADIAPQAPENPPAGQVSRGEQPAQSEQERPGPNLVNGAEEFADTLADWGIDFSRQQPEQGEQTPQARQSGPERPEPALVDASEEFADTLADWDIDFNEREQPAPAVEEEQGEQEQQQPYDFRNPPPGLITDLDAFADTLADWNIDFNERQEQPQPPLDRQAAYSAAGRAEDMPPVHLGNLAQRAQAENMSMEQAAFTEEQKEDKAETLAKMPKLAAWADKSPVNARAALDNADALWQVRHGFATVAAVEKSKEDAKALAKLGEYGKALGIGAMDTARGALPAFYNGCIEVLKDLAYAIPLSVSEMISEGSAVSRFLRDGVKMMDSFKVEVPKAQNAIGQFGQDVFENAPQILEQLGLFYLTAGTAAFGKSALTAAQRAEKIIRGVKVSGWAMFGNIYGATYLDSRRLGATPANASFVSALNAFLQMRMENMGMHKIFGSPLPVARTFSNVMNAGRRAGTIEFFTEAFQEIPDSLARKWSEGSAIYNDFSDRAAYLVNEVCDFENARQFVRQAIYAGMVGFALGGAAGTFHAITGAQGPAQQELGEQLAASVSGVTERLAIQSSIDQAVQAAAESEAGKAGDTTALQSMLEQTLPDETRRLQLDGSDLNRLRNLYGNRIEMILNMDASAIEQSINDNGFVEVDLASVLAHSANADLQAAAIDLAQSSRKDAISPNYHESKSFDPISAGEHILAILYNTGQADDTDLLQLLGKDGLAEMRAQDAVDERDMLSAINREANRLLAEFGNNLAITREGGRKLLNLFRAHALTMHATFGIDPVEFFRTLSIEHGGPSQSGEAAQVLFTSGGTIIRMFDNVHLPAVLHEGGHIFLEHLSRAARDNGRIALANLYNHLDEYSGGVDAAFNMAEQEIAAIANNPNADIAAELEALNQKFATETANIDTRIKTLKQQLENLRQQLTGPNSIYIDKAAINKQINDTIAEIEQAGKHRRALQRYIYNDKRAISRIRNIQRAKDDVEAFAHYAGLQPADVEASIDTLIDHIDQLRNNPLYDPLMRQMELENARKTYREFQEAAANGFIAFMKEGKAPSVALNSVFRRMKKWLGDIFKAQNTLNANALSDEVRLAFSRLLATDEQIYEALPYSMQLQHGGPLPLIPDLTNLDKAALKKLLDNLDAETVKLIGKIQAQAAKVEGRAERRIRKQLAQEPFWQLAHKYYMDDAQANTFYGARKAKKLKKLFPELFDKKRKQNFSAINPQQFNYQNHGEIIADIEERIINRGETFDSLVEMRVQQEVSEFLRTQYETIASRNALQYGKFLSSADRVLLRKLLADRFQTNQDLDAWIDSVTTPDNILQAQAQGALADTPLRFLRPSTLQAEVKRCLAERDKAIAKNDIAAAISAMNKLRMANAMFAEASRVRTETGKTLNLIRRICKAKPGLYGGAHTAALRKVIEYLHLGKMKGPVDTARANQPLSKLVEEIAGSDIITDNQSLFPEWLLNCWNPDYDSSKPTTPANNPAPLTNINDYTPEQLRDIDNLLRFLTQDAADVRKARMKKMAEEKKEIVNSCLQNLNDLPDLHHHTLRPLETLRSFFRGGLDWSNNLITIARYIDGLVNVTGQGQAGRYEQLAQKAIQAERNAHSRMRVLGELIAPHSNHLASTLDRLRHEYGRELRRNRDGLPLNCPEAIRKAYGCKGLPGAMLIAMAFNLGNKSNIVRLFAGYPDITYDDVAEWFGDDIAQHIHKIVKFEGTPVNMNRKGLLTIDDWKAIDGIWEALNTLWPDIAAVNEELHGFKPEKINALPFTITRDGRTVHIKGGYYPVKFDSKISDRVNKMSDEELARFRVDSISQAPAPHRGFTIARVKGTPRLPLLLSADIIYEHLNDSTRFIEFAPIIRMMDRVANDGSLLNRLKDIYSMEFTDNIRPALARCVLQETARNPFSKLVMATRPYFINYALSLNPRVALLQPTSIFSAMADGKIRPIMKAMNYIVRNGTAALYQIYQISEYLRNRVYSWDQDLQRRSRELSINRSKSIVYKGREITWQDFIDAGMAIIQWMDQFASAVIFLGRYIDYMESKGQVVNLQGATMLQSLGMLARGAKNIAKKFIPHPSEFYWHPEKAPQRRSRQEIREERIMNFQPLHKMFDTLNQYHHEAVAAAEQAVKDTNPDFDATSSTRFGSDKGVSVLFNQFSSATTLLTSRIGKYYTAWRKGRVPFSKFAREIGFDVFAPTLYMMVIVGLAQGLGRSHKDKPDDLYRFAMGTFAENASVLLPLLGRPMAELFLTATHASGASQRGFNSRNLSTGLSFPLDVAGDFVDVFALATKRGKLTKNEKQRMTRECLEFVDVYSRLPVFKAYFKAQRGYDQWRKGRGTPGSLLMPRPGK